MEFTSARYAYISYINIAKINIDKINIDKINIDKINIAKPLSKFEMVLVKMKFTERHIMSFLDVKIGIIEDVKNLKTISFDNNKIVNAYVIFNNENKIYLERIVKLLNVKNILCKQQITNGDQYIFERANHRIHEIGILSGIIYGSVISRIENVNKIIIIDNNETVLLHPNIESFIGSDIIVVENDILQKNGYI